MIDPNLIYPGRDLTNVFPEEGMGMVNEPMISVKEAENRMLLHGNKVITGTIERCAQVAIEIANDMSIRAQDKPMKIIAAIRAMKDEP